MKRFRLFFSAFALLAMMMPWAMQAQTTVTVGTGTSSGYNVPYNNYYNNSWTEIIYPGSSIGQSGIITSLAFEVATASSYSTSEINIYMATTTRETFASTSDWTPVSDLTLVYSSTNQTIGSSTGWETLTLQTPFVYDNSENLVVVVARKASSYSNALKYYYTATSNTSLYRRSDSDASYANPGGPGTGTRNYRPNAQFVIAPMPADYCWGLASLEASNISQTGATIAWTNDSRSTATAWNVVYGPAGFDYTDATQGTHLTGVTNPSLTLTGLTANTAYDVYVQAACSATNGSAWRSVNFRTLCPDFQPVPYAENFDTWPGITSGEVNNLPNCWNYYSDATTSFYVGYPIIYNSASYANSGSNSMRFMANSDYANQYGMLPQMQNLATLQLEFDARQYTSTYVSELVIGVMTDPTDLTTFVPVDTVYPASTLYEHHIVYFNNYTASTNGYITLYAGYNGVTGNAVHVDNVEVSVAPSCSQPRELQADNVAALTTHLTWQSGAFGTPQGYIVAYRTEADTNYSYVASSFPQITLTTNQNTTYYAKVCQVCSATDTSDWSNEVSFHTNCLPVAVADLPYTYGFEDATGASSSASISACWRKGTTNSTSYPYPSGSYTHSGNYAMYSYSSSSYTNYLCLPLVDTSVSALAINFWAYKTSASYGRILVGTMSDNDDMSTFTAYDTIDVNAVSTWENFDVFFSNYAGTDNYIAFRFETSASGSTNYVYLDDVTITLCPSCLPVKNVVVDAATTTSSSLSVDWTDRMAASSYSIEYGVQGFTPGMGTTVTVTSHPATLTGLLGNTTYDIYVSAMCSATDVAAAAMGSGRTTCGTTQALPYTENFDDYSQNIGSTYYYINVANVSRPSCWSFQPTLSEASGSTNVNAGVFFYNATYNPTGNALMLHPYTSGGAIYASLPMTTESVSALQIGFDYRNYSITYACDLTIGVMSDLEDTSTFIPCEVISQTTSTWTHVDHDFFYDNLPAGNYYVTFRYKSNYSSNYAYVNCYLDNVTLSVAPTCKPVRNLALDSINTSAYLSWTGNSAAYDIAYGNAAFFDVEDASTYNTLSVTTTSAVVPNLLGGTSYAFAVRGNCGTETSPWRMVSGRTECDTLPVVITYTTPYGEAFEGGTCWDFTGNITTNPITFQTMGGSGCVRFSSFSSASAYDQYAISPELTTTTPITVTFDYAQYGTGDTLFFGYSTTDTSISSFTWTELPFYTVGSTVTSWAEYEANLPMGVKHIAIKYNGPCRYYAWVDNVVAKVTEYDLVVLSNDTLMGTVTGSGHYYHGQVANLAATAAPHYHFVSWSNNAIGAAVNMPVVANDTIIATFAIDQHTVALAANDATFGTVSGAGTYNYGDTITISAMPAAHYHFVSWSDNNTDSVRTIVVESDLNLTATFAINTHVLTVLSDNETMGTVAGAGTYDWGTFTSIYAYPAEGYHFVAWNDGDTNAIRPVLVDQSKTYVATFAINMYNAVALVNNNLMGDATGTGVYAHGTTVTFEATPAVGHHFMMWSNGETSATLNFVITSDTVMTANFMADEHTVTLNVNDEEMGTVTGGGLYHYGDTVTVAAVAADHFHFVSWSDGVTTATRTLIITSDVELTATFAINTYTLALAVNDNAMGTVSGAGTYDWGTTVTISATANDGFHFVSWNDGVTDATRNIIVTSDMSYTATFNANAQGFVNPQIVAIDEYMLAINHFPTGDSSFRAEYADYRWFRNGERIAEADGMDHFISATALDGVYYCMVPADEAGNEWVSSNEIALGSASISEVETLSVRTYPNPVLAGAMLHIESNLSDAQMNGAEIRIFDLQGRTVVRTQATDSVIALPAQMAQGVYSLVILTKDGNRVVTKVVVR